MNDIRAAARREALAHRVHQDMDPGEYWGIVGGFADGAVWGATRVTPTREQIAETMHQQLLLGDIYLSEFERLVAADAIMALMAGLAEGES